MLTDHCTNYCVRSTHSLLPLPLLSTILCPLWTCTLVESLCGAPNFTLFAQHQGCMIAIESLCKLFKKPGRHCCQLAEGLRVSWHPRDSSTCEQCQKSYFCCKAMPRQSGKDNRRVLSPMEQMEQENTAVCQRYHALIQRTVDPMAKQNLRLELQRRLMDNLMAGRKKQAEYLRNLQEQEKKIAEMAARKLQGSGECITPEEKRQQELFARILQYENNREWPPALQDMLESHPKNPKVARHIVMHILGDSKHPLSQWLAKERVALQREIVMALDSRSHLVAAPKEPSSGGNQRSVACAHVESVLRTALLLLGLTLEPLKDPAAQEVCYSVLEDHFTWPLWPHLLATVRLENLSGEQRVATTISQLASASAEEMHVSPCLHKSPALSEAVGMLRTVPRLGPSHKLRVLVHVTRLVCTEPLASEDEHHRKLMGADDLIPALIYILVQSKVPQLYSEYLALEQILDSRYMLGEEGYCLASVLMAFKYLESLP
ncbi:VPS9 domain-containing protein 1-like isoform X4 [Dermacentor andersoni]|uniref:VPS9 domain-containing protein 1-like isoform X4 n=1 Tax=Dermacentor andersoni TaxID=34620 RepID=UPI003B3A5968